MWRWHRMKYRNVGAVWRGEWMTEKFHRCHDFMFLCRKLLLPSVLPSHKCISVDRWLTWRNINGGIARKNRRWTVDNCGRIFCRISKDEIFWNNDGSNRSHKSRIQWLIPSIRWAIVSDAVIPIEKNLAKADSPVKIKLSLAISEMCWESSFKIILNPQLSSSSYLSIQTVPLVQAGMKYRGRNRMTWRMNDWEATDVITGDPFYVVNYCYQVCCKNRMYNVDLDDSLMEESSNGGTARKNRRWTVDNCGRIIFVGSGWDNFDNNDGSNRSHKSRIQWLIPSNPIAIVSDAVIPIEKNLAQGRFTCENKTFIYHHSSVRSSFKIRMTQAIVAISTHALYFADPILDPLSALPRVSRYPDTSRSIFGPSFQTHQVIQNICV